MTESQRPSKPAGRSRGGREGQGGDAQSLDPALTASAQPLTPVTGVVGEVGATRSGEDTRRRGWFWHWNSLVTQYAPLIGLKGVGLVNSYTVWTDRREESPHRGYAFPSQQSEADFYGEDRAELIAINKILVALNLIEIRKEMVLRTDEQGRRWKVPHNFYRVKDHGDGFILGGGDVLRVVELADRDQTVYRYVRHIFSPRFSPIDSDNVWTRILPEVRQTEVWQRLAAKVEREEQRASARTRAGHAARKANLGMPNDGDITTTAQPVNDSGNVTTQEGDATSVAKINTGSGIDVARSNKGFDDQSTTSVGRSNTASYTSVAPSNRTYNEDSLTTTTTTADAKDSNRTEPLTPQTEESVGIAGATSLFVPSDGATTTPLMTDKHAAVTAAAGPGGQPAPGDAAGESMAIKAFEDANSRRSTPAERQLLQGLAARFDATAREQAGENHPTGWAWVTAAIYEAVEAGSAFVAPRRLREILGRWERDGIPGATGASRQERDRRDEVKGGDGAGSATAGVSRAHASTFRLGDAPDLALPHGFGSRRTWEFTTALLGSAIDRSRLKELVEGTAIVGYAEGEVTIEASTAAQAERLTGEYRDLVARKLSEAMRRPVRIAAITAARQGGESNPQVAVSVPAPVGQIDPDEDDEVRETPSFVVAECGLPSGQVWAAVLEEVVASGGVGRANFDAWLRSTALIGRDGDRLIVGVPHALAQRRIATRFGGVLRESVAAITGADLAIEFVVEREWLRSNLFAANRPAAVSERQKAGA